MNAIIASEKHRILRVEPEEQFRACEGKVTNVATLSNSDSFILQNVDLKTGEIIGLFLTRHDIERLYEATRKKPEPTEAELFDRPPVEDIDP